MSLSFRLQELETFSKQRPLHLVKFNDGEWHAMTGRKGTNCDNHRYFPSLKNKLIASYAYLKDKVHISDYITNHCPHSEHRKLARQLGYPTNTFTNYLILHDKGFPPEIEAFYRSIREDNSYKVFIGPERLKPETFLHTQQRIDVPQLDAYQKLGNILQKLDPKPNHMYLLCCGFISCIIAERIHRLCPQASIVDIGSGLDPLLIGCTRKSQESQQYCRDIYKDWGIEWPQMPHFSQHIDGWFNYQDLYSRVVANSPSPGKFVEVGSWLGKSAAFLGVEIVNSGKQIQLDIVDHFKGSRNEPSNHALAKKTNLAGLCVNNLRPLWCTGENKDPYTRKDNVLKVVRKPSSEAAELYEDGSLDFVFIDAGHTYSEVKEDIKLWARKVKPGGLLAGHDYSKHFPGVIKAVKELLPNHSTTSINCWMVTM